MLAASGLSPKAALSVRVSGRLIVAQQFTAGITTRQIGVREADG